MKIDPYRFFFPAGIFLGFWGALLWVLYFFNLINYPGLLHPEVMMGGFLLTFVVGFLCTAVPKFTGTASASRTELIFSCFLICLLFVSQFFSEEVYFRACSFSVFVYLSFFVLKRFIKRNANPPAPFLFLGIGLASGLLGSFILLFSNFDFVTIEILALGRLFALQAYILSFVLGIGSRLIPALLGAFLHPNEAPPSLSIKTYLFLGVTFFLTYFVEAFISIFMGMLIRDMIILFIAFFSWKIHKFPNRKAIHAYGLWLSCWFLLLGHFGATFFLDYKIHFMHLFYIGGLSLMTLLVATRVILAHGGHELSLEFKSKPLVGLIVLFSTAAMTRFSAIFFAEEYQSHLLYAALIWIFGLLWWGAVFIPKIIKIKK